MVQGLISKRGEVAGRTDPSSVVVGGTNSAFPLPLNGCIERASGTRVWDEGGSEYIDFLLASGPLVLGHSHPVVVDAVSRQLAAGSAYYSINRPAVDLAERVVSIPGCGELVRFASTGTEATMHAVRLARAFTGRSKVLVFNGGYHGSHDVSIVGHRGALRAAAGGVPQTTVEDVLLTAFNDADGVRAVFDQHGETIAAVLMEPQQRSVDPAAGFLALVRELCSQNGVVLIFDEVLTGFRLAFGGAQEYYGVHPDLVCYGKILGGGFPLSAVAGLSEIMALADPGRADATDFVHFSGTLSGNPVSAVAGLATLRELEAPGIYEKLHGAGAYLRRGLEGAMQAQGVAGRVHGSGPIAAVEFDGQRSVASGLKAGVNREMIARGILVQLQTRFYVSLLHTEDEMDAAAEAFHDSLAAVLAVDAEERAS